MQNIDPKFIKNLKEEGYSNIHKTEKFGIIGIQQFLFTWGLVIDLNDVGYSRRYCYPSLEECLMGLHLILNIDKKCIKEPDNKEYQNIIDPPDPYWIKCKGELGEYTNVNNPNLLNEIK